MRAPPASVASPVDRVLAGPKSGAGLGLHRMWRARSALDADEWLARLDAIKVTGSNGKGSVAAMVAAILRKAGVDVGLYTSPHLLRFHERIVVNGVTIDDDELEAAVAWFEPVRNAVESSLGGDRFGAFEVMTALALHHFAYRRVEVVVSEVGIGGRYDPTRVIPGRLAAITSIDLEHTSILGGTEEEIAFDKADLCPDGGRLVLGELNADLQERLEGYCRVRGVDTVAAAAGVRDASVQVTPDGMTFDLLLDDLEIPRIELQTVGRHQSINAAVAIALARDWLADHRPDLSEQAFVRCTRSGLGELRLPGRLQTVCADPEIVVDIGHTPGALRAVAETVRARFGGAPLVLVTGVSHDKKVAEVLAELVPVADHVICTRAHHKGSPVSMIDEIVAELCADVPRQCATTIEAAVDIARELAQRDGMKVVVAGGLFLAMEAVTALRGEDPKDLRFF